MLELIEENQQEIAELCGRFAVRRLELFGSGADGSFGVASDLDFLIEFNRSAGLNAFDQYFGLLLGLKKILGREIDLVEPEAVTNPYMLKAIQRSEKQVVYDAA